MVIFLNILLFFCTKVNAETVSMDESNYYMISSEGILYSIQYYDYEKNVQISPDNFYKFDIMTDVKSVSGNYAVKNDNTLWTWNSNDMIPEKIMDSVIECSAYDGFALILKEDSSLWGIGSNYYGQLASGEFTKHENGKYLNSKYLPSSFDAPIKIMDDVKSARAGNCHSIVLKKDGSVWTFGLNINGALGYDTSITMNAVPIKILDNIKNIFSGRSCGFAVTKDKENILWKWGCNYSYGVYDGSDVNVPPVQLAEGVRCAANAGGFTLVVKNDNSLWIYGGNNINTPFKAADNINFVIGSDDDFENALVLDNNGVLRLLTFSDNADNSYYFDYVTKGIRTCNNCMKLSNSEDICEIHIQLTSSKGERDELYNYTSKKINEIKYIVHYINLFNTSDKTVCMADYEDRISVEIKYNSGLENFFDICSCNKNSENEVCTVLKQDFQRFLDFVQSLQDGKIKLKENISFIPSQWANKDIEDAIYCNLVPKWSQIDYQNNITRLEVCHLVENFLNINGKSRTINEESIFSDTKDESVVVLNQMGIINGKSSEFFYPYDFITREELAKILYNTYLYIIGSEPLNVDKIAYNDNSAVSDWAIAAVSYMTDIGIFKGNENNEFEPKRNMTKEEMIVTLLRLNNTRDLFRISGLQRHNTG